MRPKGPSRVCFSCMKETLGFSTLAPPSRDSRPSSPSLPLSLNCSKLQTLCSKAVSQDNFYGRAILWTFKHGRLSNPSLPFSIYCKHSFSPSLASKRSSIFDLLRAHDISIFRTTWTTQFQWRCNVELPSMGPVVVEERQPELVP